jgi:hypothetical protein
MRGRLCPPRSCGESTSSRLGLVRRASAANLRRDFEQLGMWQGLAWQHLIARRGIVEEDGFYYCSLLQVSSRKPLVNILIGVNASSFVVARILNELKSGNTHLIVGRRW